MKRISIASVVLSLLALRAIAQPPNPWVGLWQPSLEEPPGVVLTVGDDDGRLAGAVVFNVIARQGGQAHILGHDAHALLNPRVDGRTLHFQVLRRSDNRILDMTVHMTADGKATFHCQNCGESAPEVEIIRER